MVHEVSRPLAAIRLGLAALAREERCAERTVAALDGEVARAARSLKLLSGRNSRPGRIREKAFSVVDLALELETSWKPVAEALGRSISVSVDRPCPPALGDRDEIGQATTNLLMNELEHGHGDVRIDVRCEEGAPVLEVSGARGTDAGGAASHIRPSRRVGGGRGLLLAGRDVRANGGQMLEGGTQGIPTVIRLATGSEE